LRCGRNSRSPEAASNFEKVRSRPIASRRG
jgi:hypothetical protein